jgi:hypothetical protein
MPMYIIQIPESTPVRDFAAKFVIGQRFSFKDGPGLQTNDAAEAIILAKKMGFKAPILRDPDWEADQIEDL